MLIIIKQAAHRIHAEASVCAWTYVYGWERERVSKMTNRFHRDLVTTATTMVDMIASDL